MRAGASTDDDHTARYGGGAECSWRRSNGQTGFPIRAGVLHDNGLDATYVSGGLGIATHEVTASTSPRRFAVSGPSDKMIIASMRFYGPAPSDAELARRRAVSSAPEAGEHALGSASTCRMRLHVAYS